MIREFRNVLQPDRPARRVATARSGAIPRAAE
jgi:hypothetical protein